MKKINTIAIDGPVASGKSTVGEIIANKLSFQYLDTGVMYRGITWLVQELDINVHDEDQLRECIVNNPITLINQFGTKININGRDLESELRSPGIDQAVSDISKLAVVRTMMVHQQQAIASKSDGIVMVGRDIGTVVLENADLKIFLQASVEARAKRRLADRKSLGLPTNLTDMVYEITQRDFIDENRDISPLKPAIDAVIIDTDNLDKHEVVDYIINICE